MKPKKPLGVYSAIKEEFERSKNLELMGSPESASGTPGMMQGVKNKRKSEATDSDEDNYTIDELIERQDSESDAGSSASNGQLSELKQRKKKLKTESVPSGNICAERCFKWLIAPGNPTAFFEHTWEKEPYHLSRQNANYYKSLFTCKAFDKMMRENILEYSKNIDVVEYCDGERITVNPEGRAFAAAVWNFYQQGYSVRMLNPQKYNERIWQLCSLLQEFFGSNVGVNMYLTPPGCQGFAPHYDDIEAFVLQLEGKKNWKIYQPISEKDKLPRLSSPNFSQNEIGSPFFECELQAGDLLYFPRGFIHQAKTTEDTHSLHITVSTYQKNTWGDLLQLMLPQALNIAMGESTEFRESLPKDYMNYVGSLHVKCDARDAFKGKVANLTRKLVKYLPIDDAVDQHVKDVVHASLPPVLSYNEKKSSIHGNGEYWKRGEVLGEFTLTPDTRIRFIRKRGLQLVSEEGCVRLYHNFENGRDYKEFESKYIEVESPAVRAIEFLLNCHPQSIRIEDLPFDNEENKMIFATDIYNTGLVMTEN